MADNKDLARQDEEKELAPVEYQFGDIEFGLTTEPRTMDEVFQEAGIATETIEAAELVGKTFVILRMKEVPSEKRDQGTFFYAEVVLQGSDRVVGVALGGRVVMDKLITYARLNPGNAPMVTLIKRQGGRYGEYYDLK